VDLPSASVFMSGFGANAFSLYLIVLSRSAAVQRKQGWLSEFRKAVELALPFLQAGQRVTVSFDFGDQRVDWEQIIALTERNDRLHVVDTLDPSEEQILASAANFLQQGGRRLALSLQIAAAAKAKKSDL
jgi:hypothetical protein